jgi:hypothetical protein
MREFFVLDTSKFPLVVGTYQDFIPTAEEFCQWQLDLDAFNADHENYVLLLDFSKVQSLSTEHRIQAAKWASRNDALFVQKNLKAVIFTPSLGTRIMMKAFLIMVRPRSKYMLVSSLEKAHAWANQQLAELKNS